MIRLLTQVAAVQATGRSALAGISAEYRRSLGVRARSLRMERRGKSASTATSASVSTGSAWSQFPGPMVPATRSTEQKSTALTEVHHSPEVSTEPRDVQFAWLTRLAYTKCMSPTGDGRGPMKIRILALIACLSAVCATQAQQPRELLQAVPPDKARQLLEYNERHLQEHLYFAARYRVVEVDTELLLNAEEFTITLFEDIGPITLERKQLIRGEDNFSWFGSQKVYGPAAQFYQTLRDPLLTITALSWDLDTDGNALLSSQNRFRQSPQWKIDEQGNVNLDVQGPSLTRDFGPPPETAEDIAWHRRVQQLDKHAFYSVLAQIVMADDAIYWLRPMELTRRYVVVYEVDQSRMFFAPTDVFSAEDALESDDNRLRREQFERFRANLRPKPDLPVRGDVK